MSTQVVYNEVVLNNCTTDTFRQEIVHDKSGSDTLYAKFTIGVTSTVVAFADAGDTPNGIQVTGPIAGTSATQRGSIAEQIRVVHQRLSEKRKNFWYLVTDAVTDSTDPSVASNVLLIATGQRNGVLPIARDPNNASAGSVPVDDVFDVNHGPTPMAVDVKEIMGSRTMRVSFTIEVCRRICDPNLSPEIPSVPGMTQAESDALLVDSGSDVLSNRWSIRDAIGEDWKTTRTIEGELRISDMDAIAHAQRYLVVPPLLRGYRRVSQTFVVDPSGLNLKYTIVDKQEHEAPPRPAIAWDGTYTETAAKMGSLQHSEIDLTLTGPPGVDKQQLIGVAGQIVAQRLHGIRKDPLTEESFAGFATGATVVDVIGQPQIRMRVRMRRTKIEGSSLSIRVSEFGLPLEGGTVPAPPVPPGNNASQIEQVEHDNALAAYTARFGASIAGYDHEVWPVPHFQDRSESTIAGVFTTYSQHPCSPYHNIFGGGLTVSESKASRPESCLLYTSPSPRDLSTSRMPSSA